MEEDWIKFYFFWGRKSEEEKAYSDRASICSFRTAMTTFGEL